MFGKVKKISQFLPEKVSKDEEKQLPIIEDPQLLTQKRKELNDLVKKAAEDGEITQFEYNELCELMVQVGVNNYELNEMIRIEYKKALKAKVQFFVEDDGIVDEAEMKNLFCRAKEIGVDKEELNSIISESLSKYKVEQKKIYEERKRIQAEQERERAEKREESKARFAEKASKLGKILLGVGIAAGAAYVGLKAQKQQADNIAASQGNYSFSNKTITHQSSKKR